MVICTYIRMYIIYVCIYIYIYTLSSKNCVPPGLGPRFPMTFQRHFGEARAAASGCPQNQKKPRPRGVLRGAVDFVRGKYGLR